MYDRSSLSSFYFTEKIFCFLHTHTHTRTRTRTHTHTPYQEVLCKNDHGANRSPEQTIITLGLVGFDVSTGGWTHTRRAVLTSNHFTEMTANDVLWSFIRRLTCVPSKYYFQDSRIAYSLRKKPRRNYQEIADVKLP